MKIDITVFVKQVVDPDAPISSFHIDPTSKQLSIKPDTPFIINGFDETAVEAALRLKDSVGANITVVSLGYNFVMDVIKKPLSMGADNLILLQDAAFQNLDSFTTAKILSKAVSTIGNTDLFICGRQASDWDNAQVPLVLSELLGLPCLTIAKNIRIDNNTVEIEKVLPEGHEVIQAKLPAIVTVSNELGEPRYATLRGIMSAGRKTPSIYTAKDLNIDTADLSPKLIIEEISVPDSDKKCEMISGDNNIEIGRKLALKLRESRIF